MRPVAITAVGVTCGLGHSLSELSLALLEGRCGIAEVKDLPAARMVLAGDVPKLQDFPDDRKVHLLAAAAQAVLSPTDAPPARRGVYLGTGLSSVTPLELEQDIFPHVRDGRVDRTTAMADLATDHVAPRRHLPARATAWLADAFGAEGPTGTTFSACAAGAEAIAAGARAIARGDADVVLAGGHDAMAHPLGLLSFDVLGALSPTVCRPFDAERDGFTLGEGAALLRLESLDRCSQPPLAVLLGAGTSLDAHGITAPHPEGRGAEAAMRRALRDAGIRPDQVDWVNTHGTGTSLGDAAEAAAISRVFGPRVAVSSLKGALGHTLAAAGAVEAVATVAALRDGFLPGTVGCSTPAELGVRVILGAEHTAPRIVVSNSFGFGGQNCSLVFALEVPV